MLCKGEMVGFVDEFREIIDDRLQQIDCWRDRLKNTTHSNSDRLLEIDCWGDRLEITTHGNSDRHYGEEY
jgi:hypothetical protein